MRQAVVIVSAGLLVAGCGKELDANEPPEIYHYTLPNGVEVYTAEPADEAKGTKRLPGQHD